MQNGNLPHVISNILIQRYLSQLSVSAQPVLRSIMHNSVMSINNICFGGAKILKHNNIKLILDFIMYILFVLLMKVSFGGLAFHEIAGLGIGFVFLVHILLNLQWVKKVTLRLFDRKLPGKTRFGYLLNILLLISMTFIIVSGILISKLLFPNLNLGDQRWFRTTHILISYLSLILTGIHIGLHWQWIVNHIKKIFKVKPSKIVGTLAKVAIVLLLVFGGYQIVATQFASQLANLRAVFNITSQQMPPDEVKNRLEGKGLEGNTLEKRNFEDRGSNEGNLGERPSRPDGSFEGKGKGEHGSSNPLVVIAIFSGIIGGFVVITYYLERLITRRKK